MAVVRRPRAYTALSLMVLLAIPIFFLNIWVLQKGAMAKIIHHETLVWMGVQGAWAVVTLVWLLRASRKGLVSLILLATTMFGVNIFYLVTTRNYALAFYALFLLIVAGLYCLHVVRSLGEAYYHPGQRWFEGRPPFLPAIEAGLKSGDRTIPARLSRLGVEGCYAYPGGTDGSEADAVDRIELKLGDLALEFEVELVSRSKDGAGRGFRFLTSNADQSKDIRDFIDRVRSSGYVA